MATFKISAQQKRVVAKKATSVSKLITAPVIKVGSATKKTVDVIRKDRLATTFNLADQQQRTNLILADQQQRTNWRTRNQVGICLQGGGMKGAFGVGALHFLAVEKYLDANKRMPISSASTGSLTAVILQENNGTQTTMKAILQYMAVERAHHMLTLRRTVEEALKKEVTGKLRGFVENMIYERETDFDTSDLFETGGNLLQASDRAVGRAFSKSVLKGKPHEFFQKFKDEMEKEFVEPYRNLSEVGMSLAQLLPVKKRLVDSGVSLNSRADITMSIVSLNTGALCYLRLKNNVLTLLYPPSEASYGDGFAYELNKYQSCPVTTIEGTSIARMSGVNGLRDLLIKSALTSGAFPGLFEPQSITFTLNGVSTRELFVDGGLRENLPLQILTQDDAVLDVIAIHCSPITEAKNDVNRTNKQPKWHQVGQIALAIQAHEAQRFDRSVGRALNVSPNHTGGSGSNVIHIAPTMPTLGLLETNAFKIKATIWYGYMRASDEMLITESLRDIAASTKEKNVERINLITELRVLSRDVYIFFNLLQAAAKQLVEKALYTVRGTSGRNVRLPKIPMKLHVFGEDFSIVAFPLQELSDYLKIKHDLLDCIVARSHKNQMILKNRSPNLQPRHARVLNAVMAGPAGFRHRRLYLDWIGVYEYLESVKLPNNCRTRLMRAFNSTNANIINNTPGELFFRSGNDKKYKIKEGGHTRDSLRNEVYDYVRKIHVLLESKLENNMSIFEGEAGSWHNKIQWHYESSPEWRYVRDNTKFHEKDNGFFGSPAM